jgi:cyclic pyranopterin phosphate synthase
MSKSDSPQLTHLDAEGNPRMVDVGEKPVSSRVAVATGRIVMGAATREAIVSGQTQKGNALLVAEIAGIQATKRTADLIPLCHPIPIERVEVRLEAEGDDAIRATATVGCRWVTGVEMEALTAVSIALLTVYDMAKALDRGMQIEGVRLLEKHGGRSGSWVAEA